MATNTALDKVMRELAALEEPEDAGGQRAPR